MSRSTPPSFLGLDACSPGGWCSATDVREFSKDSDLIGSREDFKNSGRGALADYLPNESGGAFLNLRAKLAARQAESPTFPAGNTNRSPNGMPASSPSALFSSSPPSNGAQKSKSPLPDGWMGSFSSLGSSVSTFGNNLMPTSQPPSQSNGILKNSARGDGMHIKSVSTAEGIQGGDSFMSTNSLSADLSSQSHASSPRPISAGALAATAGGGNLPEKEIKDITEKVGQFVRTKKIRDAGLEAQLYKKIAHRDAHVLMAWTVYLCNGDDDMLVKAFEDRCRQDTSRDTTTP